MAPTFTKAFIRVASLNSRNKVTANAQELQLLLQRKRIDILAVQEVKSHLPVIVNGYAWHPGQDRFTRPNHHVGLGFLIKKDIKGLVTVIRSDTTQEFMWLKVAGKGTVQDTFICNVYCLTHQHPIAKRQEMYATLLESCTQFLSKGEVLLVGDFNARLGAISEDRDSNPNGKLLQSFLRSAFADGDNDTFLSLLNTSFECRGLPTRCENGRTSIIDYLITAPESLHRVLQVRVECHDQLEGANALGSDHHLLFVDWRLTVEAPEESRPLRIVTDYSKLQEPATLQAFQAALSSELSDWTATAAPV